MTAKLFLYLYFIFKSVCFFIRNSERQFESYTTGRKILSRFVRIQFIRNYLGPR